MSEVFFSPIPDWRVQNAAVERFRAYRDLFSSEALYDKYFRYLLTPKSGRWFFKPNGKTGTTSALDFLFYLEFGTRLSVDIVDPEDLNNAPAPHRLASHSAFRLLHHRTDGIDHAAYFRDAKYIVTVRDPFTRALSGFRYLCKSQKLKHPQFSSDRTRMCALVGFDWGAHMDNEAGFERFLEYLKICIVHHDAYPVDTHWAPQWLNIRPDVRTPDIVGRTENMSLFYEEVASVFSVSLDGKRWQFALNNTQATDSPKLSLNPRIRSLMRECFEMDYTYFNYEL